MGTDMPIPPPCKVCGGETNYVGIRLKGMTQKGLEPPQVTFSKTLEDVQCRDPECEGSDPSKQK